VDHTEFIKLKDFEVQEIVDPDALMEQARGSSANVPAAAAPDEQDELLKSLGM